jgi:TIR domain
MRVFLSWSGQQSQRVAYELKVWLQSVFTQLDTWMSEEDVAKGSRWSKELAAELERSRACIICVTPDNTNSIWMHFEAGAIAKTVDTALVCPFLVGLKKTELSGPLSQFQVTVSEREDVFRLINTLNNSLCLALEQNVLARIFDVWWPHLDSKLKQIDLHGNISINRVKQGIGSLIQYLRTFQCISWIDTLLYKIVTMTLLH